MQGDAERALLVLLIGLLDSEKGAYFQRKASFPGLRSGIRNSFRKRAGRMAWLPALPSIGQRKGWAFPGPRSRTRDPFCELAR